MTRKEEFIRDMIEFGAAHELACSNKERFEIEQQIDELYEKHWKEVKDDSASKDV